MGGGLPPFPLPPAAGPGTRWSLPGGARAVFSGRTDGDLAGTGPAVHARRRHLVDLPWSLPRQVHGPDVVVVSEPGGGNGRPGDAVVTTRPGAALAVLTADCAPVVLASPEGALGVAHAGWRGLAAGVLEAAVATMRRLGAGEVSAVLGPCVHPCCYEFGPAQLEELAARFGPGVVAADRRGRPALDLPAGVRAALAACGVALSGDAAVCTGCSEEYYSWRARREPQRQATVVWR